MTLMIWAAAFIELCIENFLDFSILLFIQFANAGYVELKSFIFDLCFKWFNLKTFQYILYLSIAFYETTKAADAVSALKKSLKPEATVKRDGKMKKIDAAFVSPCSYCDTMFIQRILL